MSEEKASPPGRTLALGALVFFGGFSVMVLEIVGARYLQPWFGSAFYVWVSQIGVVMLALAMGYAVGGRLADRWKHAQYLGALQVPAAVFILLIPSVAPGVLNAIVDRHGTVPAAEVPEEAKAEAPLLEGPQEPDMVETNLLAGIDTAFLDGTDENASEPPPPEPEDKAAAEVPEIWKKLDPAIGSAVVFLLPCFALAMISPYMIRIAAQQVSHVGTVSGLVYAASTVGSIGGIVVTAYVLIDHFGNNTIFYITGGLTLGLAGLCCVIDWLWPEKLQDESD